MDHTLRDALAAPFPVDLISFLAVDPLEADGAWTCTALPIVDADHYRARLDAVAPGDWSDSVLAVTVGGGRLMVAASVTIAGVTHAGVGDAPLSAAAPIFLAHPQAFRRACRAFGLGASLWRLPQTRAPYDPATRQIACDALALATDLYGRAGIPLATAHVESAPPHASPLSAARAAAPARVARGVAHAARRAEVVR